MGFYIVWYLPITQGNITKAKFYDAYIELEQYLNEKLAIGRKAKKEQDRLKKVDIEELIMDVYVYILLL